MAGTLAGFDGQAFRDGIHLVQEFFTPAAQRATFHFPTAAPTAGTADSEGVPFDPAVTVTTAESKPSVTAPCSVTYEDLAGGLQNVGYVDPSRIIVTLLDVDYVTVKGFEYVEINNVRYYYRSTKVPNALGDVTVWSIRCVSEDEG